MKNELIDLLDECKERAPEPEEALFIMENTEDKESALAMFDAARQVRDSEMGDTYTMTGGIATVLECTLKPLCNYCPYWRNKNQTPLSTEEIIKAVDYLTNHGIYDFHLSGGTTLGSEGKDVLHIVKSIYEAGYTNVKIDVNCGAAMSLETLKEIKKYNVKMVRSTFETLSPSVFRQMKPGDSLEKKMEFAYAIGEAGINLGTGLMAGLSPDETKYQDYVDFMYIIKKFPRLVSLYVSKFYPFDTIALKGVKACEEWEAARAIALARLILRNIDIGAAQGWQGAKEIPPDMVGAGNTKLGIHINRTPTYIDITKQGPNVTYEGNLEFRNNLKEVRENLEKRGYRIVC